MKQLKIKTLALSLALLAAFAVQAQSNDDLKKDGANTDNVLTYGMGYGQQRFSKLSKINKTNV